MEAWDLAKVPHIRGENWEAKMKRGSANQKIDDGDDIPSHRLLSVDAPRDLGDL